MLPPNLYQVNRKRKYSFPLVWRIKFIKKIDVPLMWKSVLGARFLYLGGELSSQVQHLRMIQLKWCPVT